MIFTEVLVHKKIFCICMTVWKNSLVIFMLTNLNVHFKIFICQFFKALYFVSTQLHDNAVLGP